MAGSLPSPDVPIAEAPSVRTITFGTVFFTVKELIALNAVFLLGMTLFRAAFFLFFARLGDFKGMYLSVAEAFFLGFRFDLSVAAYINTLVTLTLLIVWAVNSRRVFEYWARALVFYYTALYTVVLLVLIVDLGFFSYFKTHINSMIYGFFEDDTMALVRTIAQNHLFIPAFAALCGLVALIFLWCRRNSVRIRKGYAAARPVPFRPWMKIVFVIVLVSLNGLAARGSLRMFPLSPIYAEISSDPFINKLSLNGIFALGEAMKLRGENNQSAFNLARQFGYEGDLPRAFSDFTGEGTRNSDGATLMERLRKVTPVNKTAERLRPDVVVIIMESFGGNLLRYDRPDFDLLGELRRHIDDGYMFHRFLPAGLITIHAVESIVLNIPQRPFNLSVTQSEYAMLPFPTAATLPYKRAGYATAFVYGGSLGWRQMDTFLRAQGFDTVLGEGAMPAAQKNQWGVYDEYLFDAAYRELNSGGAPKFVMIMTTTNHPPYSVPASYRPGPLNIPEDLARVMTNDRSLAMKRFVTYQYGNQKLGEFISRIRRSERGRRAIIAVTGDHNFWDVFNYGPRELFYRYSVPFYLFIPDELKPAKVDASVAGSHMDIMPTLYHLSLSHREYYAMGSDLLGAKAPAYALDSEGLVISRDGAALFLPETGQAAGYAWDPSSPGMLLPAPSMNTDGQARYYKAASVVSEFVIKNTRRAVQTGR